MPSVVGVGAGLGELRGGGERGLGLVEPPERDPEASQAPQHLGARALVGGGAQQTLGGAGLVVGDAVGGGEQLGRVDRQTLGRAPGQQPVPVARAPGARRLERGPQPPVGLALLQRRGPAAQELGVERVGQRHVQPAPVARRGDQPLGLEPRERVVREDLVDDLAAEGLAERQRAHEVLLGGRETAQAVGEQLDQAPRRMARRVPAPHRAGAPQRALVAGAVDQLAEEPGVAQRQLPEAVERDAVDVAAERAAHEVVRLGAIELGDLEPGGEPVAVERVQRLGGHRAGGHREQQEHLPGARELGEQDRGGRVQEVGVVDDDEVLRSGADEQAAGVAEQGRGVGERRVEVRQEVAEGAERDVPGGPPGHRARRAPAARARSVGHVGQGGAREPGAADPARAADDDGREPVVLGGGDGSRDRLRSPDQWSALGHARASLRAAGTGSVAKGT